MTTSRMMTAALVMLAATACRSQEIPSADAGDPGADTVLIEMPVADPEALSRAFSDIASTTRPSVVTITSRSVFTAVVQGFPALPPSFGYGPWQGFGFPAPEEREYVREGLGSGVIIDARGYIVTNNHVVEGADELEVILQDGTRFPASLTGTDPRTDLAVVRIEPSGDILTPMPFGDAESLRVGQIVLAVGSPFALSSSVTQGIISFIGRTGVGLADYEDFIQTDAAINPGNSGGALVDLGGRLVGINTAIASRTGGYDGIGFAIPVDLVRSVTGELIESGYVSRGYLGVMIQDITPGLAEEFSERSGIIVSEVTPGGPADLAGVTAGDVIVELDGRPVESVPWFRNEVASLDPGDPVALLVSRSGRRTTIRAEAGELPGGGSAAGAAESIQEGPTAVGWTIRELDQRTSRALGYDGPGLLVAAVDAGGAAASAGLAQGDIIVEMDRTPVSSVDEAHRLVSASEGGVLLFVFRGGHTIFILLELG